VCRILDFKVNASLDHGFVSLEVFRTWWTAFQAKNNVRSAPANSALTVVSNQSQGAHTANRHLRAKGERNGLQKRTKIIFDKTMMQALHGAAAVGKKAHVRMKQR